MLKAKSEVAPFAPAADDALAAEHEMVSKWVEDAFRYQQGRRDYYRDLDLKVLPAGQAILDAKPDQARRLVMAAVAQVRHWDHEAERIREASPNGTVNSNVPGWEEINGRRQQALTVAAGLLRRALPMQKDDLVTLIQWCPYGNQVSRYHTPAGAIVKAIERYAAGGGAITADLGAAMRKVAAVMRGSYDKDVKKLATVLEQLDLDKRADAPAEESTPAGDTQPTATPAPAGNPRVLVELKKFIGVYPPDVGEVPAGETLEPDRFVLRADSPLQAEHRLLGEIYAGVVGTHHYHNPPLMESTHGDTIRALDDEARGRLQLAAAERAFAGETALTDYTIPGAYQSRYAATAIVGKAAQLSFALDRDGAFDYLLYVAARVSPHTRFTFEQAVDRCLKVIEGEVAAKPLSEGERYVLHLLRASSINGPPFNKLPADVMRLNKLIGDGAQFFLVPGEAWSDALNNDLRALPPEKQQAWIELLKHCLTATSSRPSAKWLKGAEQLVKAIGKKQIVASFERWMPLVSKGQTARRAGNYAGDVRGEADTIHEENATILRGMLWIMPALKEPQTLARLVTSVALSAYKKVPGVGPRAVKVGNAAIYALSEMASPEAVGQLAMLKVRVKFGTAQKEIEKAFNTAAEALGLPRDQIEEMGVPSYGLEEVGLRRETFVNGEYTAELRVDGRDVEIHWSRADGKPQKSVPAKVKSDHKEELKELQTAAKDVAAMLPAQSERLDSMFLLQKQWDFPIWRERYLDHPLVGTLARRLIWTFDDRAGIFLDGRIVDVDDEPIDVPADAKVALWHPIGRPMDDVLSWRAWLEKHRVRQPFKQAHREVYLLTDAERRTNTYSNRFAAHIIRQHQFNALCAARGWKNRLRLMVDDSFPPATKELPTFGLRAEFWIEGIGDDYGNDTTESGAFLRLSTDQVRFYRSGAAEHYGHAFGGGFETAAAGPGTENINEPVPLEQIPPLALSEVMRDVDLFVGVASVGNDPTWQDGGPGGRYQTYWQSYSFGDLTETAKTRKAVLERLVPRLKIAAKCSITDKFLVVKGELRTYKIHLGSGNILMEPNDQYLCIVPARGAAAPTTDGANVFLPFEGDATLSIILSKAFLLADDKKIKDETITRQIGR